MSREMLRGGKAAAVDRPVDKRCHHSPDERRVVAVRAGVDDGVERVVIDIGNRGIVLVYADRAGLHSHHPSHPVRVFSVPGGAERHRVGESCPPPDAHGDPPLEIGCDKEGYTRERLEPVEEDRLRIDIPLRHDDPTYLPG